MLNKIRQLSSHPIILLIFGMLILVFVLFFGMPSMGGIGQDGAVFSQWSAQVNEVELTVNEGLFYARRRSSRRGNELTTLQTRLKEMNQEALIDQAAREMQWESTEDDHLKYIISADNLDAAFFSTDQRQAKDIWPAFKQSLGADVDLNQMNPNVLMQKYLAYARKIRGFKSSQLKSFMNNYSTSSQEYLDLKGRELRIKGYLDFLRSQIKSNSDAARDDFDAQEEAWRFSYVQVGEGNVALDQKASTKKAIDKVVGKQADRIKSYYNKNIENYSKSSLSFTNVTARYANAGQEKTVKEKIEQARARIIKGEDAVVVAKSLSKNGITISAFVQNNKTRKNTDAKLFDTLLKMEDGKCSEINKRETPKFIQLQGLSNASSGTYSFARLQSKKPGEEKSVKDVERAIAQILIHQDERQNAAKKVAQKILKDMQSGKALVAVVEDYNKTLAGPVDAEGKASNKAKVLNVSETGFVKIDALLSGSIEGLGRSNTAAETLLKQLNQLSNSKAVVSEVLELNQNSVVLSMSEHQVSNDADFENAEANLTLEQIKNTQRQFFGGVWLGYSMVGPMTSDIFSQFPREVITILSSEFSSFFGRDESFLDQLLASDRYQAMVRENPVVDRYFKKVN
jgi:hypothetical protein